MKRLSLQLLAASLLVLGLLLLSTTAVMFSVLPPRYQSVARVLVSPSPPSGADPAAAQVWLATWQQDQTPIITSQHVLRQVSTNLNLARKWAERFKEKAPLREEIAVSLLRAQLSVRRHRNSSVYEIAATSEERVEAAQLANEVMAAYLRLVHEVTATAGKDARPVSVLQQAEPALRGKKARKPLFVAWVVAVALLGAGAALGVIAFRWPRPPPPRAA